MEKVQIYNNIYKILVKDLVKDVIFHLLTVPNNWRYERDEWSVGEAKNLDEFIEVNSNYLYREIINKENAEFFNAKEPNYDDDEEVREEYFETQDRIFDFFYNMFPTIRVLHGDNSDDIKWKFLPEVHKIYHLIHNNEKND